MKKKQTNADVLRSWGITDPVKIKAGYSWLRYKNPIEKGIYWYYFSIFIRERDVNKYGTCISCGRPITMESSDAGHFMPASACGRDLLFDEYNVNAECSHCNAWDDTHLLGYRDGLEKRYGAEVAADLRKRKAEYHYGQVVKDWSAAQYAEKIKVLPTYQQRMQQIADSVI